MTAVIRTVDSAQCMMVAADNVFQDGGNVIRKFEEKFSLCVQFYSVN